MQNLKAFLAVLLALTSGAVVLSQDFQENFNLDRRKLGPTGKSKYFVLMPGYQVVLADKSTTLSFTVLNQTKTVGRIVTRVVEEKEVSDGKVIEVARNFYAIDTATGDVFHFGEEVDAYENGKIVSHEGSWLAYKNGARPGLLMPGNPRVGMKYYQEIVPGVVMDRAEVLSLSKTVRTPAGEFRNCLQTEGTSKLDPNAVEFRIFAPGVGLVQFESLKLIRYGFHK
ncbi:hypothetical protein [uncultured Meiothermus sp.]|mgnify:CR=1 FL=1|jgi:hypothetical protein|uniref:hypothetical protein n=1 Tax=uncultured Meiothermus sp. TaxID=157471 RepID=UPI0026089EAF|nr:hypothetical protein [uncultured Meiothermus sp.]